MLLEGENSKFNNNFFVRIHVYTVYLTLHLKAQILQTTKMSI